jgi:ribonuclease R
MSPPRSSRSGGKKPGRKGSGGKPSQGKRPAGKGPARAGTARTGPVRSGPTRAGRASNARVVWPPQERTESARDAIEQMLLDNGLARSFARAVEREAKGAAQRAWRQAPREGRRDLRELATFTVDPSTARDFDDAISAERLADGAIRVWVHIADVAAHVPEGSVLDSEARRRSTSVYVPGTVEPMLPHALSSDACSLVPNVDRLAVTVELVLRGAEALSASFYRSIIRSDERLDYEQVDRLFAGHERAPEPWGEPLAAAREAAAALQDARESGGALVIESEEPEFRFDERGNVLEILPRVQTESHRLIEHLMIAANEAVARRLAERKVPCLYRVHERPDPGRIRELVLQLDSLGVPTPPLPDSLSSAQAADLVGEISRLLDAHVRRTGRGRIALSSLVLRSLKQAVYSPVNAGHAGLRSPCYCHFTSPIRRYPDIVCHRGLLSSIGAGERPPARRELDELGEWCSERERDAARMEHRGDDIAAAHRLEQDLIDGGFDRVFAGEVTGLIGAGAFIAFGVYEGMLPVRMLTAEGERDWWELNEHRTILRGERTGATLRLGDEIDVRVMRVDATGGRVDLAPAG